MLGVPGPQGRTLTCGVLPETQFPARPSQALCPRGLCGAEPPPRSAELMGTFTFHTDTNRLGSSPSALRSPEKGPSNRRGFKSQESKTNFAASLNQGRFDFSNVTLRGRQKEKEKLKGNANRCGWSTDNTRAPRLFSALRYP
ncbi:hypothetical protein GJAV_G00250590 [Gymnothorax javanicus]|nr:hypothetical protein GJAV_G00250590 [Gymnothorax javanicus]